MSMPLSWRTRRKKRSIISNCKESDYKILLPQERDANKSVANVDKPITTSNVVNKVREVAIEEDQSLSNVT
jgi:hypothetical protein